MLNLVSHLKKLFFFFCEIDNLLEIESVLSICSIWVLFPLQVSGKTWKTWSKEKQTKCVEKLYQTVRTLVGFA